MFQGPWLKPWLLSNSAILICNVYHLPLNTPPFFKNLPRSVPVLTAFKKSYCILSWLRKRRIWTSSRIVAGAAATALKYELHLHRSRPELDFLNYRTSFLFCFVLELVYSYIFLMLRLFRGLLFLPAKPLFFFLFFPIIPVWMGCWGKCSASLLMCVFSWPKTLIPFSVSTASPNNPAVHGDPGEPALHCWIRPSYPGCVPAVLCPAGLRVIFFPLLSRFF